jgi:hypothetical protein
LKLFELILEDYITPLLFDRQDLLYRKAMVWFITPLFFDTEDSDDPDSVTPRAF